ncbi:MAG: C-terminal binding protein [Pseudomonadales bacterium]|nr:C-terminal binding protein [Pseudomonadales bacterium]MCP5182897.1 C-terminal binding protein [Pseudomonadales bacterium]
MTYRILWPMMRWPGGREIETASVADGGEAIFHTSPSAVPAADWANCDAIVNGMDLAPEYRAQLSRCRIFVKPAVGFDNIDLAAWGELGIPVCNVPDYGTQEVADHAIALMMTLMKGITFHTRELKKDPRGNWRPALNPFGRRLSVCTFGVVGLGRIGTAAALRAKAFGMNVIFYDPFVPNGSDLAIGVRRVHSLEALFGASDVVSVHAPLEAGTEKLINADVLAASKPGLILVNTARGPIVDLDALYEAMKDGRVQAAGLDVLPEEPANAEHPLIRAWAADEPWIDHRLVLTPHSAFFTPESVHDMRYKAGEVALAYLKHGRLQNCVNEAWLTQRR